MTQSREGPVSGGETAGVLREVDELKKILKNAREEMELLDTRTDLSLEEIARRLQVLELFQATSIGERVFGEKKVRDVLFSIVTLPFRAGFVRFGSSMLGYSPGLWMSGEECTVDSRFWGTFAEARYLLTRMEADMLDPKDIGMHTDFLPIEPVFGEYSAEKNKILIHLGAIERFSDEVNLPLGLLAVAVGVHEITHALLDAAFPEYRRVREDVIELLVDVASGAGLRLVSFFGLPIVWEAWKVFDSRRFQVGEWLQRDICHVLAAGLVVASAILCGVSAKEMLSIYSEFLAQQTRCWVPFR